MDSFELNKIAGAILFALLVLFGTRTATDIIFAVHKPEKPGFEVAIPEGEESGQTEKAEAGGKPLAVRLASADPKKGEAVHKKCLACHTFDEGGANKIGPNLHGVVGRPVASHEGFSYSAAMKSKGGNWTYEDLDAFLTDPKKVVSGTKMSFAGVKSGDQRADLILFLRTLSSNPPPLPEPPAEGAEKPAEGKAAEGKAAEGKPAEGDKAKPGADKTGADKAGEKKAGEKPAGEDEKPAQGEKPAPAGQSEEKPAGDAGKTPAAEDAKPAPGTEKPAEDSGADKKAAPEGNTAAPENKETPAKPESETAPPAKSQ